VTIGWWGRGVVFTENCFARYLSKNAAREFLCVPASWAKLSEFPGRRETTTGWSYRPSTQISRPAASLGRGIAVAAASTAGENIAGGHRRR
jgi:hypothetical protein